MNNKTIKNLLTMAVLATATTGAWGAAAPHRTGWDNLPLELQHRILELAVNKDPKTYESVACVCKDLNAICKDELFKRDFLKSLITNNNCPEFEDFIHNPAPEKLGQKFMFKGEQFTLKEVVESCEVFIFENLCLRQIPVALKYFVNLKKLVLSQNPFSSPEAIDSFSILGELKKLEVLNLYACDLKQIPPALSALSELKALNLCWNSFSAPEGIKSFSILGGLKKLEKLTLDHCNLKQIPPGLGALNELKELVIWGNDFSSADATESFKELIKLSKLEKLDLAGCGLKQISPVLSALSELKELVIWGNDFSSADATKSFNELSTLSKLEKLYLGSCGLKQIPPGLGALSELKEFDITNNDFSSADATESFNELSTLSKLEKLELGRCSLKQIPSVLSALSELKELALWGNNFSAPEGIESFKELSNLSKLEKLELRRCGLKQIPPVLSALSELKELSIGCNDFSSDGATESFAALIKLPKLEKLGLFLCGLKQIPPVVGALSELKELVVCGNNFSSADATESFKELIKLSKLEELVLARCSLKQIPSVLGALSGLKKLDISGNDFSSADATKSFNELSTLSKLEKLELSECGLKQIPPVLFELNELKELTLGGNTVGTDAFKRARPDVKLNY